MKKIIYQYIFLFILITSFTSDENKDRISWSSDYSLKWTDFQGIPDMNYAGDALTSAIIIYEVNAVENDEKFDFKVNCFFDKKKSWVKKNKSSDYLLKHEQLHFDIAEIYSRKMQKQFNEHHFTFDNLKKDAWKIYDHLTDEWSKEEKLYDKETNHSKNTEKQKEWNLKVEKLLKQTEILK